MIYVHNIKNGNCKLRNKCTECGSENTEIITDGKPNATVSKCKKCGNCFDAISEDKEGDIYRRLKDNNDG